MRVLFRLNCEFNHIYMFSSWIINHFAPSKTVEIIRYRDTFTMCVVYEILIIFRMYISVLLKNFNTFDDLWCCKIENIIRADRDINFATVGKKGGWCRVPRHRTWEMAFLFHSACIAAAMESWKFHESASRAGSYAFVEVQRGRKRGREKEESGRRKRKGFAR